MTIRDECLADASQALADTWAALWQDAHANGLRAAAERAAFPGRDPATIETTLREAQERAKRTAA